MTAVFHPDRFVELVEMPPFVVRIGSVRPAHAVYVRRRLIVCLLFLGLLAVIGVSAHSVLADRGGVPASTPAIRSAPFVTVTLPASITADSNTSDSNTSEGDASSQVAPDGRTSPAVGTPYLVQPGDTLWGLAERFHGALGLSSYVDALVEANGGSMLQPGQLLLVP